MFNAEKQKAAKKFAALWAGRGYEKGESQAFWISLLHDVYGVENVAQFVVFEDKVVLDRTSFIDVRIPDTSVLIEQKSLGKDLKKPIRQSDGAFLSPFQQAKRYSAELPYSLRPRWIVTCNFSSFLVYDMKHPTSEPEEILLKNLEKEYYRLNFLVDTDNSNIKRETEISVQAGSLIGDLYEAILKQYICPTAPETLRSLNMLCVRVVFCLYAEDTGIFGGHLKFHDYLAQFSAKAVRRALIDLFSTLGTPLVDRDPYMEETLASFPYVNGGLFTSEPIEIPQFTDEIVDILLHRASEDFDWSGISPTIFGAVFESTLNPETRRSGGMHYTSIENIHKVIDPLFLDDLKEELAQIKMVAADRTRARRLAAFQEKLAALTFLDPACGSGNFLTETYLCLRRLENEALRGIIDATRGQTAGQIMFGSMGEDSPIQVSIRQFYGIEINDFAVTVARTALWIAELQTMQETENVLHINLDFLPLKSYANIVEGNALRLDWEEVVPRVRLNYIMGNPPFVGARVMAKEQKSDLLAVFGSGWKNVGNLDYVSCWYKKATDMMKNTGIRTALVSTNSVSQGEGVANLWRPLFEDGVHIDFAHRTFRWDSEAKIKAHVHCVIVGFSVAAYNHKRVIYTNGRPQNVDNINGYLIDADNVFVESRSRPICNVPEIGIGNQPIDGGNYLFTKEERDEFLKKEPEAGKYFRPWYGAQEFINRSSRYCLWLGDCTPHELRRMPECMKRIEAVRQLRLASKSSGTRKIADRPARFHVENMPKGDYLVIPRVSSEQRRYVPMGFLDFESIVSDAVQIVPDATIYHFGVLTSNVHMAWMRAVCGRLESCYRYSKDIVYNNFPWPEPTDAQRQKIEQTAQGILDARDLYPDSSLADLYDELTMPPELRRAHQLNDRAVMEAYGFSVREMTESSCVAELMTLYRQIAEGATEE